MAGTVVIQKKKKTLVAKKPREPKAEPAPQFGTPLETDTMRIEFHGLSIRYILKKKNPVEVLTKEYDNPHALMIIYGRIRSNPAGDYAKQCVAKARIAMLKSIPLE